ncbi:response regulator [Halosegnis marinus]|uniref:Response regulator n=1 Tax=Halosegnis marinus TaxID=3034023 RepID=A0ABD5ZKQ0_9EURY
MGTEEATVLIVEDEEGLLDVYARWLGDRYEVRTATTAEGALDALDDSVDVVLLDRLMPDTSGTEVLDEIRARTADCRVAMVTAVEPDFDIIDMGFDDYLTKPVKREHLHETVRRLLARDDVAEMARRLFALATKRSVLQSSKRTEELEESEEYAELQTEMRRLRRRLDESLDQLGSGEMVSLVRELEAETATRPEEGKQ